MHLFSVTDADNGVCGATGVAADGVCGATEVAIDGVGSATGAAVDGVGSATGAAAAAGGSYSQVTRFIHNYRNLVYHLEWQQVSKSLCAYLGRKSIQFEIYFQTDGPFVRTKFTSNPHKDVTNNAQR